MQEAWAQSARHAKQAEQGRQVQSVEVVCEVENMMGLVRERLVMDPMEVTPQPLVSGAGGGWRPRPVHGALVAAAGAFVLVFV